MTEPAYSFFCPAYRDAGNLPVLVPEAHALLAERGRPFEILIVEDGCPEGSAAVADELASRYPEVRAIHHGRNLGYGHAIRTGLAESRGAVVLYTDGDRQFDVSEFVPFFAWIDEGWDLVTGFRRRRAEGARRRLQTVLYRSAARWLVGSDFRDPNCAFKMMRREVIDGVALGSGSAFVALELLLGARRAGFRIREEPVTHLPRLHGAASGTRPSVVLDSVRELWRYRVEAMGSAADRSTLPSSSR